MTRVLRLILLLGALGLLSYRFWHVDLAPFARDEPQFLRANGARSTCQNR